MRKNLISPTIPRLIEESKSPVEHFRDAVNILISNFRKDALQGNVRVKNIEDVNRLIAINAYLESMSGNDSVEEQKSILAALAADDPLILGLYEKMFDSYNETNDKANEEHK